MTLGSGLARAFRGSLRLRLMVGALLWVSAALLVIALMLVHLFRFYAEDDFYSDLINDQDQIIAALPAVADGQGGLDQAVSDPQFDKPYSGLYWQVDGSDRALYRSRSLWDFVLKLPADAMQPGEEHRYRLDGPERQSLLCVEKMVLLAEQAAPVRVVVAQDARALDASVRGFSARLSLSFLALGVALVAAAALQVWTGLRPLHSLRLRLGLVRRGEARRLEGDFPQEVQPLIDDLNTLLDHQAEVVERARVMAGNLAHGLKTPLAVIANEASRLEQSGKDQPAEVIRAQIGRMQRQIDYHIARARAAAARAVPGVRCHVRPSVEGLVRVIRRVHAERDLDIRLAAPETLHFLGERQDFEEMVGNLLDNAAKWARRRVRVTAAAAAPGRIEVAVEDDGPGLPADQCELVFARGHRLDEAMPGSGLGLAIVRDLAEMYDGEVSLQPLDGGGLRARLQLPGA